MPENQSGSEETLRSLVGELDGDEDADSRGDPTERTEAVVEETADAIFDGRLGALRRLGPGVGVTGPVQFFHEAPEGVLGAGLVL